jgi:hypothetical protein
VPKEDDKYEYPLLMKGTISGRIINMTAYGKGTVVGSGHGNRLPTRIGQYSEGWSMECFIPFVGVCHDCKDYNIYTR